MAKRDMDRLAAEYALGTLDRNERIEAEHALGTDTAFARKVELWERRLASLSEAESEITPPDSLWKRIEASLPAKPSTLANVSESIQSLKRSLAVWRYATVGAVAAAVAMALVWVGGIQAPFGPAAPTERYVAVLQSKTGETGFVVTMDMSDKQFAIRPVSAQTPADGSYELWCIMPGKSPAMTVGLVKTEVAEMMKMPVQLTREELEKGVELAVSMEPKGGAPSGRSMGPIMFAGLLLKQPTTAN